jgi:hypothetical protein
MATRSFLVSILNSVLAPWHRTGLNLIHGVWSQGSDGIPSEVIPAAHVQGIHIVPGDDWFMSESDGFATGTEGWVDYMMDGVDGTLRIYWDNPFAGGNRFTASGPRDFTYNWGDPGGSDAHVTLRIESAGARVARDKKAATASSARATARTY